VEPKKKVKKEYIIITKEDIAYLQQNIIEFADIVATTNVDTAVIKIMERLIQKIRTVSKK
jgi:hypothetical protein